MIKKLLLVIAICLFASGAAAENATIFLGEADGDLTACSESCDPTVIEGNFDMDADAYRWLAGKIPQGPECVINSVYINLRDAGTPSGNMTLEIYSDTGAGVPNASLGTATTTLTGAVTNNAWYGFDFSSITRDATTDYWFVVKYSVTSTTDYYEVNYDDDECTASDEGVYAYDVSGPGWYELSTGRTIMFSLNEDPT